MFWYRGGEGGFQPPVFSISLNYEGLSRNFFLNNPWYSWPIFLSTFFFLNLLFHWIFFWQIYFLLNISKKMNTNFRFFSTWIVSILVMTRYLWWQDTCEQIESAIILQIFCQLSLPAETYENYPRPLQAESTIVSEGFKGGTRGAPIMPRDAVSRTANAGICE